MQETAAQFHVEERDGWLYVVGGGMEPVRVESLGDAWDTIADLECDPSAVVSCEPAADE
jgi:hypothetical protein